VEFYGPSGSCIQFQHRHQAENHRHPHDQREESPQVHKHQSLKNDVSTRWNSTLEMIESLLDLKAAVDATLKKTGNFNLCLDPEVHRIVNRAEMLLNAILWSHSLG
jgi:hypothetical protein